MLEEEGEKGLLGRKRKCFRNVARYEKEAAMEKRVEESSEFVKIAYEKALLEVENEDSIERLGKACSILGGLPSTFWLLLKYDNYVEAMKANVLSGGDSSARGMIVGMIHSLKSEIPKKWQEEVNVKF